MRTEQDVITALRDFLAENLQDCLEEIAPSLSWEISGDNISLMFPNPDNMKCKQMLYLGIDRSEQEVLSVGSDKAVMDISACIICKGEQYEILLARISALYNAVILALRRDQTVDENVDGVAVSDCEFYPAVEAQHIATGCEFVISAEWVKSFV